MDERERFPGYEWEVELCCVRCGSTHYLIVDEETKEIYCGPCLQFIHEHQKPRPMMEISEEDDFCL
jgi:hypothetical protein